MVAPAVVAGAARFVGGLLSGNKRRGEARVARRAVDYKMEEAIRYAKKVAKSGQSSGYDFVKLRDDALKAGFNPLTVLGATGGQGYDLASPFGVAADMMVRRAELVGEMSGAVIDNAGYFGEALSDGFGAYFAQKNQDTQFQLERQAQDFQRQTVAAAYGGRGFGGGGVSNGSPFHSGPVITTQGGGYTDYYGLNAGPYGSPAIKSTQGLVAMINDTLGRVDARASWWNGRPMTGPENVGMAGWGAAWDSIAGGVSEVPYRAWKLRTDVAKIWNYGTAPSNPQRDLSAAWKRATAKPSMPSVAGARDPWLPN